jgi:hypothetical protein
MKKKERKIEHRVYKYAIPLEKLLDDVVTLEIPICAEFLSVVNQNENLTFYFMVDPNDASVEKSFRVAGTGHPLHPSIQKDHYLGTVLFVKGSLVFHIFEWWE